MEGDVPKIPIHSDVTTVLKEIAEEEIDEVDIIMEDISDEIKDLQQSILVDFEKEIKDLQPYHDVNITEDGDENILHAPTNQVSISFLPFR